MKFLNTLKPACLSLLFLTIILGIFYPLMVFGLGQLFFYREANGSLVEKAGQMIGSRLIGQNFTSPGYFHPRPSCAGAKGYDAANSSGSNLGPTSQKFIDTVSQRVSHFRSENRLKNTGPVPGDAVTASGSGLDPHITVANARDQAPRIAEARGLPEKVIQEMISDYTIDSFFSFSGEPYINVLELNLALDINK